MRASIIVLCAFVGILAVGFFVSAVDASGNGRNGHPARMPSTPFLAMKKHAAERLRHEGVEICDYDDDEESSPGNGEATFTNNRNPFRKVIRASYVFNASIAGDLDANLHPTYYRSFYTQKVETDWFAKKSVIMGLGLATHMDSPCHVFAEPCLSITDFNATQYTLKPLVVVNITNKVFTYTGLNADYELSVADLQAWESHHHKRIPSGAFVAMMSGWSNRVYNDALYENRDSTGQKHFPGFSNDAIDWLLTNRPWISGIGVDTSSVDSGINWSFHVHYAINGVAKISIENLKLSNKDIPLDGAYISNIPVLHEGAPEATVASTIYVR